MKALLHSAVFMIFISTHAIAQQFEVGKATDAANVITADTLLLIKAINRTLNDGTVITGLRIESKDAFHYLVAEGSTKTFKKLAAFSLSYHIDTRTYYAEKDLGYVTCASAACNDCSLFKENGKITGCKCAEKSTISNQCNFTRIEPGLFYRNIIVAKQIMKKKK